uniref:Uncharacterized protein n=1 Tax=Takifugu rubripes TaxID=31033 RepID=A0A3B5K059_TAKRU
MLTGSNHVDSLIKTTTLTCTLSFIRAVCWLGGDAAVCYLGPQNPTGSQEVEEVSRLWASATCALSGPRPQMVRTFDRLPETGSQLSGLSSTCCLLPPLLTCGSDKQHPSSAAFE